MPWTFVRPVDPQLLAGRPLLDLGTGDAQTLSALVEKRGLVVGLDRSMDALHTARSAAVHLVNGDALSLPFGAEIFATVVAGDLFHHLDDDRLRDVLGEIARILAPGARLVAWWYQEPGRPGPGAPRFPRSFERVASIAREVGFQGADPLELEASLDPAPLTVGLAAAKTA